MIPTPARPLAYFENYLLHGGHERAINEFADGCYENAPYGSFDREQLRYNFIDGNQEGILEETYYSYKNDLNRRSSSESENARSLILSYIVNQCNGDETSIYQYLKIQVVTIQNLINNGVTVINEVPVILVPLKSIFDSIKNIFNPFPDRIFNVSMKALQNTKIVPSSDTEITDTNSFEEGKVVPQVFHIKEGFRLDFFQGLYRIAVKHSVIVQEDVSFETFANVLLSNDFSIPIKFSCKNETSIQFLKNISSIFEHFNARLVEDSGGFITKGGSILTQTNYNRAKSKLLKKQSEISQLKQDINVLIEAQKTS